MAAVAQAQLDKKAAANKRHAEVSAQIAEVDTQLNQLAALGIAADSAQAEAIGASKRATAAWRAAERDATGAQAAFMVDTTPDAEAKLKALQATRDEAKTAADQASADAAEATRHATAERSRIENASVALLAQRESMRNLAESLAEIGSQAHAEAGAQEVATIHAEHTQLLGELASLRDKLKAHWQDMTQRMAPYPELWNETNGSTYHGADLFAAFLLFIDALERQGGSGIATLGGVNPAATLSIGKETIGDLMKAGGQRFVPRLFVHRGNAETLLKHCLDGTLVHAHEHLAHI